MSPSTYGDIAPKLAAYSVNDMLKRSGKALRMDVFSSANDDPPQLVKPIDIECRHCKAPPGVECTKWKRPDRKVRRTKGPHPDRKYDARCASDAARALSFDEPDTVVFTR
jgi:hypothetical protein